MSSTADEFAGGGSGMEEQFFLLGHLHHEGGGGLLFHVPQHSRREKLRFPPEHQPPPPPATSQLPLLLQQPNGGPHIDPVCANFHQIQQQQGFSLSLSPAAAGPLGPFTGYAAVLNRSRFLEPARLLLEEVCELGRGGATFAAGVGGAGVLPEALVVDNYREMERTSGEDLSGHQWRKTSLISMLDEIYRRYRLYYEQVQTVITSFEKVAGLNTAAPYVSMALKSMTKHFTCIKDVICNHLNHLNKALGKEDVSERDFSGFGIVAGDAFSQKGKGSSNYGKPPVWRPQRGLPERAVAVLRAWLFEHFLHPYPTDTDKQMLAKQTGLTRNQVSNWFINARVRLWKPMVEEIHNLEMRQSHKPMAVGDNNQNHSKQASHPPPSSAATSATNQLPQNGCLQRNPPHRSPIPTNYELSRIDHHIEEPYNFFFDDFSSHGQAVGDIGASSGVSLTLGLHQNHGVCMPEPLPLPMNVAHRFGLEECSNAYILGGFEGQDRLFGKDIGGHLLHDFVG